jgi:ubiquinone biosynthesis protein UbiJ
MLNTLSLPAVNRLLRSSSWALDRFRPHAGKTIEIVCPPFSLRYTVRADGLLETGRGEAPADATIAITPGMLVRAAARDPEAFADATISGDVELGAAVDYVRRNIAWDYEEDLSRIVGDVAAHRIAAAARRFDAWGRQTALNLAHAAAEYVTHERALVASRHAVEDFNRDVDALRNDVERLAKRLTLLDRRFARPHD